MEKEKVKELRRIAKEIRLTVLEMIYRAGSGHPGGSLSAVEILAVLYFNHMRIDPKNPLWKDRDRFIPSKGHCAPTLYAALAKKGFFPKEDLLKLRQINSPLQGHPDMNKTPGVDMSTGSLGHGLSVAVGMALGGRISRKEFYVYVLLGCGEIQEGEIWEAAMAASKYRLEHLIAFLDYNQYQLDGPLDKIMPLGTVRGKWEAFGWRVLEADGHDIEDLCRALEEAKSAKGRPTMIIAHTVKGKGVSFMENTHLWHGKHITEEDYQRALAELRRVG